ncbi:hypothetical protein ACFVZH_38470 [Streptomyces sp. NPDC059534]|uniref:hypothetical protein n=1 Tax=Streptomyces sp. NPDC059534 TaxID=3346859 RepID=UPI0036B549F7
MADETAVGGGGVQAFVQRAEADLAAAEFADHVDQVLEGSAVVVERGDEAACARRWRLRGVPAFLRAGGGLKSVLR